MPNYFKAKINKNTVRGGTADKFGLFEGKTEGRCCFRSNWNGCYFSFLMSDA